jgi:hypothetical protein
MSRTSERRARRTQALRKTRPAQGGLQNRNLWVIGGAAVVLVALLIIAANVLGASNPGTTTPVVSNGTPDPGAPTLDPSIKLGVEVSVPNMGGQHVAIGQPHAKYNSTPPTSGPHYDAPAPWGDSHTTLPEETWIHNMEHGGIAALYNCPQGCPGLVQSLDDFLKTGVFSKYGYVKMVVTPYSKIPNKLTLVAWNYYLPLADYDDAAMRKFFKDHQDNGPEDIP